MVEVLFVGLHQFIWNWESYEGRRANEERRICEDLKKHLKQSATKLVLASMMKTCIPPDEERSPKGIIDWLAQSPDLNPIEKSVGGSEDQGSCQETIKPGGDLSKRNNQVTCETC